jgi:phosphatidylglycerophosphate synthase
MPDTKAEPQNHPLKEPVRRTVEIEERSNLYLFVPLSMWLVPKLAFLKISPNTVSLTSMAVGIGAGFAYFQLHDYRFVLLGFLLMAITHVLDGADGALARLTNSQSEFGKIIDGVCDYIVFASVYVALALAMIVTYGADVWYIVVAAGLSHAFQAGAYELQRQEYEFWGHGKKSAQLPEFISIKELPSDMTFFAKLATIMGQFYARMQYRFSGLDSNFRPQLYAYLASNPKGVEAFRASYRAKFAPFVKRWGIMCANYRTYAIFLACIVGQPILYFVYELLVLNLVLVVLVKKQKKANQLFLSEIGAK